MNKLDFLTASLAYDIDALMLREASVKTDLETVNRLIILVPVDLDFRAMTRRIWELAIATGSRIQFLSLCNDAAQEPRLRRELVTLSALIQDGRVCTEVKVEVGTNWLKAVKRNYQAGDRLVCFAEQRTGLLHKPLSQILQGDLDAPVYILSGIAPQNLTKSNWLSQIMAWMGSLGILIGSLLLQIQITSLSQGWAQSTMLILSVIGEISLILGWNRLFG